MRPVPIDTICLGDTSIIWTSSAGTWEISVVAPKKTSRSSWSFRSRSEAAWGERRARTRSLAKVPSSLSLALAWATTYSSSSSAVRKTISSVTLPSMTLRYGVSRKPKSLTLA